MSALAEPELWNRTMPEDDAWNPNRSMMVDTTDAVNGSGDSAWVLETPDSLNDGFFSHESPKSRSRSRSQSQLQSQSQSQSPPVAIITPRKSRSTRKDSLKKHGPGTPATEASPAAPPSTTSLNSSRAAPSDVLPESYVTMIFNAYGNHADLYRDVLCISRNASPRAIRIAYFKRGREVLSERTKGGLPERATGASATISGGHITDLMRLKFQAVSVAYEIISNPAWLDTYERIQWVQRDSDEADVDDDDSLRITSDPSMCSTRSLASLSALRRSSSAGSLRSRKSVGGVHWNEQVEELVFNQDPDEQRASTKKKRVKKKKKGAKKKRKKRIAVEADNLEKHLEQLDKEAESNFVHDFLDDLEQSIDQFLNFSGEASEKKENDDKEEEEEEELDPSRPLFSQNDTYSIESPPTASSGQMPSSNTVPTSDKITNHSSKNQELVIEDEEFEMYESARSRDSKPRPTISTNPFDDVNDDTPDSRQEATDSLVFESTPRQGEDEEDVAEDLFVSFRGQKHSVLRQARSWGDAYPKASTLEVSPIRLDFDHKRDVVSQEVLNQASPANSSVPFLPRRSQSSSMEQEAPLSPQQAELDLRSKSWNQSVATNNPTCAAHTLSSDLVESSPQRSQEAAPPQRTKGDKVGHGGTRTGHSALSIRADDKDELLFSSPDDERVPVGGLQQVTPKAAPLVSNDIPMSPPRSTGRRSKTSSRTKSSKYRFEGPKDIEVTKNYTNSFDGSESAAYTVDDSVSTLSASVVQRNINRDLTNSRYKEAAQNNAHMERVQEEEGSIDVGAQDARQMKSTPETKQAEAVSPRSNSQVDPADMMFCFHWCADEDDDIATMMAGGEREPDFATFLMSYLNAMTSDLAKLGHSIQEKWESCSESVDFVSDNDLQGMLSILESEMEEVPDDIAKTLSQEFVPGGQ